MRWGIAFALLIILGAGFFLRASPGLQSEGLTQDAAYHLRRALAWDQGSYGEIDALRFHPQGHLAWDTDPPGLYAVSSIFLGSDPEGNIRVFQAAVGALISLVGFLVASRLWGSPYAGLLAAAFLAVAPGHVVRTFAPGFRYDGLGTLLIGAHLFTLLSFLNTSKTIWLFLTSLLVFLSLTVWRATVGFAGLEILVLAGIWVVSGDKKAPKTALAILLGLMLGLLLPYMRAQGVLWSQGFFLTLLLGVVPFFYSLSNPKRLFRAVTLGLVLVVSLVGRQAISQTAFDREEGSAFRVWLSRFGWGEGDPFLENLYSFVRELGSPGVSVFWNPNVFSCGLLLVVIGVALWFLRNRNNVDSKQPSWVFVFVLTLVWVALTALADRNKVFASLFLAAVAGSWVPFCQSYRGRLVPALLAVMITGSLGLMGWSSYQGSKEFVGQFDPALEQLCAFLQEEVRDGEGVASDWGTGYALQTYAQVPTLT
ncbi:MAG: hypothetical protein HKN21_12980, partial [Candidatus Eisenbacteria bacterium]|nr:hypothetical protein [Candidatus Eisenbacteria bacterium]